MSENSTPVCLEVGSKKIFASALDWPGWSRAGKTEEAALEALAAYRPRYRPIARIAGTPLSDTFSVVERLPGTTTTDFGAPAAVAAAERLPADTASAARLAALAQAAWAFLAEVAATSPAELRKGPRGGGRDRDKMVDHVNSAEASYARMIGIKRRTPEPPDAEFMADLRAAIAETLGAESDGSPLGPNGWPARYAARRIAWHVLDHAWEMQDRAEP